MCGENRNNPAGGGVLVNPQDFQERYRLLIADADGTIRRCKVPNQPCPNADHEWELIPQAFNWLNQVDWRHYYLGIASNQGGVELGYLDEFTAYQMLKNMVVSVIGGVPPIESLQICTSLDPNHPDRKPNPGMLIKLMQRWRCAAWQTLMVGDREEDLGAATAAGCDFIWAKDLFA